MTTEPMLLTEAQWRDAFTGPSGEFFAILRERGLIAEEPVDPLLIEVRNLAGAFSDQHCLENGRVERIAAGSSDSFWEAKFALAALRRGRDIGLAERPTLTREMVRSAYIAMLMVGKNYQVDEAKIDRLHAALTEALQ